MQFILYTVPIAQPTSPEFYNKVAPADHVVHIIDVNLLYNMLIFFASSLVSSSLALKHKTTMLYVYSNYIVSNKNDWFYIETEKSTNNRCKSKPRRKITVMKERYHTGYTF